MQPEEHIGESAELYAIGALEPAERDVVDAHIAHCPECLRRVGEAEETVLALERATVADEAPVERGRSLRFARRRLTWLLPLTAAAAFVLGLLIPRPTPQNDVATLAMIGSHFSHAQFAGSGPPAKVIYARDRSWFYVIVAGPAQHTVVGLRHGTSTTLGTTRANGKTTTLFVRTSAAFDRLQLLNGGTAVETASLR